MHPNQEPTFDPERRSSWWGPTESTPMEDNWMWIMAGDMEKSVRKAYEDLGITSGDPVNHPAHYCNRKMEAIDIIEMIIEVERNPKMAYNLSNVLKYLLRFRDKGKPIQDLEKARWYLDRMIKCLNEEDPQQK